MFWNSEKFCILYKIAAFGVMCSLFRKRFRYNSLRYAGRDYSLPGKYFVTICTAQKTEWFGSVINSKIHLSEIGHIASQLWYEIPVHFPFIDLAAFVVMPNHLHGIIAINRIIGTTIVGALHATPVKQNHVIYFTEIRFIIGRCPFIQISSNKTCTQIRQSFFLAAWILRYYYLYDRAGKTHQKICIG